MVKIDGDVIKIDFHPIARFLPSAGPIARRQFEDLLTGKTAEDEADNAIADTLSELRKELEYVLNNHAAHRLYHKEVLDLFDKAVARV